MTIRSVTVDSQRETAMILVARPATPPPRPAFA
jgi:hypothetical protein